MAKEIILYNLKDTVTDEEYKNYCEEKKGPFLSSLPSCKNFSLIKILGSKKGEIPYKKEWIPKVGDFHILFGEEVYGK